jgi:uncharacterized protein (DUF952 family)
MDSPRLVYRIVAAEVWARAVSDGRFNGTEHDVRDGFIHFSTAQQLAETAARHYAGQPNLLLVGVAVDELGESLRFEPSRGGALFPHLYGALPTSAARFIAPLALDGSGVHVIPPLPE